MAEIYIWLFLELSIWNVDFCRLWWWKSCCAIHFPFANMVWNAWTMIIAILFFCSFFLICWYKNISTELGLEGKTKLLSSSYRIHCLIYKSIRVMIHHLKYGKIFIWNYSAFATTTTTTKYINISENTEAPKTHLPNYWLKIVPYKYRWFIKYLERSNCLDTNDPYVLSSLPF